jgi:hypothetical protein
MQVPARVPVTRDGCLEVAMARWPALLVTLFVGAGAAGSEPPTEAIAASWPTASRDLAADRIAAWGAPDEVTATALTWLHPGAWKRATVYREARQHLFPSPHEDALEVVVDYAVAPDRVDEIARFDGSVGVDRTGGEVSVRADSERAALLTLNLAAQVASAGLSAEGARRRATDATMEDLAGGDPVEMRRLQFASHGPDAADADEVAIPTPFLRDHPRSRPPGS